MVKQELNNDFSKIFENLQNAFWIVNPYTFEIVYMSDAFCTLLGFASNEITAKELKDIFTAESFTTFSNRILKSLSDYEQQSRPVQIPVISVQHYSKNGEVILSEVISFLIPDANNKIGNVCCFSSCMLKEADTDNISENSRILKQQEELRILKENYISLIEELENRNSHILKYNDALTKSVSEKLKLLSKLNEAQHIANIGSWEWNIQSGELWWSEQLYNILEVDPTSFIPGEGDFLKFVHPDDKELFDNSLLKCMETGDLLNFDFRIITRNGNLKYCHATAKVTYFTTGKPAHFTGTLLDITPRVKAEESLKKMNEAIRYIITETSLRFGIEYFNAMVLALCKTMDADYSHIGILQPDRQTIKTIALSNKEQILPGIEYKLQGTPCETVVAKITSCYQKDVTLLFPKEKLLQDMHIEGYIGVPLYYKSGEPLGLIVCLYTKPIEDTLTTETIIKLFTDRAVNEYERFLEKEQLELALKKAEESDRLKSMFLQNMSHEIRTPMNAVIGFAELLPYQFNNKEKLSQFSHIIQKRSKDLLDLINDILDLSRIESGNQTLNIETCDINSLLYELDETFQVYKNKRNKKSIKLIFKYLDASQSTVATDRGKLKQVLVNLINNAIKFTEKGEIEVGYTLKPPDILEFYVRDTGIGIPLNKQSLIFNRFMQVSNSTGNNSGGTGLGLAIVKGLVELLGGTIQVESKEGEGSRFSFTIKYQQSQGPEKSANQNGESGTVHFENKVLLLVEDDDCSARYVKELLSDSGFTVHHEVNGTDAIRYVQNNAVDIVLLDIRIPEMDGYLVARQIKEQFPHIKIIAQTAYAMQEDRNKAIAAGCDDYMSKPLERVQLLHAIQSQLIS